MAEDVRQILGHGHVNVGSPSHWHLDHLGYAGYGGFWCLIEEGLLEFDMLLDRDGGRWRGDLNGNGECDEALLPLPGWQWLPHGEFQVGEQASNSGQAPESTNPFSSARLCDHLSLGGRIFLV